jgi:hypothetical protein
MAGQCVVIGLQSTGEAAADAAGLEPGPIPGFVSTLRELLGRFLEVHFPVARQPSAEGGRGRGVGGGLVACRMAPATASLLRLGLVAPASLPCADAVPTLLPAACRRRGGAAADARAGGGRAEEGNGGAGEAWEGSRGR